MCLRCEAEVDQLSRCKEELEAKPGSTWRKGRAKVSKMQVSGQDYSHAVKLHRHPTQANLSCKLFDAVTGGRQELPALDRDEIGRVLCLV